MREIKFRVWYGGHINKMLKVRDRRLKSSAISMKIRSF